jgi:release factor glutamine methyltransferase
MSTPVTINTALQQTQQYLAMMSDSPRLDAELLVAATIQQTRSWIFAHLEQTLTTTQAQQLHANRTRRLHGEPMAYILEHKEFWGLEFKVTADVLVPRPETEHLVEWVLNHFHHDIPLLLADLGVGSGAIAVAIGKERPAWQIDAIDQSAAALAVAQQNAVTHQIGNIRFHLGDWCSALPQQRYDLLLSNPPYLAANDAHLQQLKHEPIAALSAGIDGLDAMRKIIAQAPDYLIKSGYLVLEHGYNQAAAVIQLLQQRGFSNIQSHFDLAGHPRFVTAVHAN